MHNQEYCSTWLVMVCLKSSWPWIAGFASDLSCTVNGWLLAGNVRTRSFGVSASPGSFMKFPLHQPLHFLTVGVWGNIAPIIYKAATRRRPGNLVVAIGCFQVVAAFASEDDCSCPLNKRQRGGTQVLSLLATMVLWHSTPILLVCTVLAGSVGAETRISIVCWFEKNTGKMRSSAVEPFRTPFQFGKKKTCIQQAWWFIYIYIEV